MQYRIQPIILGTVLTLLASCAPHHARTIREDRSITLGLPGVSYRPNGSIGLGVTVSAGAQNRQRVNTAESGFDALTVKAEAEAKFADERLVTSRYTAFNPFLHWYPMDDSAFFLGVSARLHTSRYQYQEETSGSTSLAPSYTDVELVANSNYVGLPIGWAWIWESGISFALDFGPLFRVSRAHRYVTSGEEAGVDVEKRERTAATLDSIEPQITFGGGTGILGYSF